MTRAKFNDEQFAAIWNDARNRTEVAIRTQLSTSRCAHIAQDLRQRRPDLRVKKFHRYKMPKGRKNGTVEPNHIPSPTEIRKRMAEIRPREMSAEIVAERSKWYPVVK